jgi:hypothetical protein
MTTPTTARLREQYGAPDDLAQMGEASNLDRADWAVQALDTFRRATGSDDDTATAAADLICDLLHLVTLHGCDDETSTDQLADNVHASAWEHFTAEVGLGYDDDADEAIAELATDPEAVRNMFEGFGWSVTR